MAYRRMVLVPLCYFTAEVHSSEARKPFFFSPRKLLRREAIDLW